MIGLAERRRSCASIVPAFVSSVVVDMDVNYTKLLPSDPEVAHLWVDGLQDLSRLSEANQLKFVTLMLKFWKLMEGQYWSDQASSIDTESWKIQSSRAVAMYRYPGVQQYFAQRLSLYSAEFVEFLRTGNGDSCKTHRERRETEVVA